MKNASNYDKFWYRNNPEILASDCSTAVDVLDDRKALNIQDNNKKYKIRAYTPNFKISVENDTNSSSGNKIYVIENLNFGIIDTPKMSFGFEKVMTNVRVTNAQGNIVLDGNPSKLYQRIEFLSNLDEQKDKNQFLKTGSDYAKIEIKNEELYGAKLEITYGISIINNSDVNFYEDESIGMGEKNPKYGYYYMFGIIDEDTKEVNITIDQVNDYLDNKLTLTGNSKELKEETNYIAIKDDPDVNQETWQNLYSQKAIEGISSNLDENEDRLRTDKVVKDTAILHTSRILSNSDEDMDFENGAEVIKIHVTENPPLVEDLDAHSIVEDDVKYTNYFNYTKGDPGKEVVFDNPSEYNLLTVIPPTGFDMMTIFIYITATAIAGIIMTVGIIVIKKKVI